MPKETKSTIIAVVAAVVVLALLYIVFVRPMMMSGDARVLLVASDVLAQAGGKSKLESYLSSANVAVVPYNYDRVATYAELGDLIKGHLDSTGASRVRSVGIMYHTPNRYNLKCFASDPEKSTVSGSLESFEPFRRFVVALRGAYGVEDVDLVSCDVVSAESSVLSSLDFNGARVNASTNTTGQVKQGPVGDWVLELGNVNLIGRYFNASITTADLALTAAERAKIAIIYLRIGTNWLTDVSWKIVLTGMTASQWPKNQAELIAAIKNNPGNSERNGVTGQKAYTGFLRGVNQLRVPFGKTPLSEITDHPSWNSNIPYPLTFMDSNSLRPSIYTIAYSVGPNYEDMRASKPESQPGIIERENSAHSRGDTIGYKLSNPNLDPGLNLYNLFRTAYTLPMPLPPSSSHTNVNSRSKASTAGRSSDGKIRG